MPLKWSFTRVQNEINSLLREEPFSDQSIDTKRWGKNDIQMEVIAQISDNFIALNYQSDDVDDFQVFLRWLYLFI